MLFNRRAEQCEGINHAILPIQTVARTGITVQHEPQHSIILVEHHDELQHLI